MVSKESEVEDVFQSAVQWVGPQGLVCSGLCAERPSMDDFLPFASGFFLRFFENITKLYKSLCDIIRLSVQLSVHGKTPLC